MESKNKSSGREYVRSVTATLVKCLTFKISDLLRNIWSCTDWLTRRRRRGKQNRKQPQKKERQKRQQQQTKNKNKQKAGVPWLDLRSGGCKMGCQLLLMKAKMVSLHPGLLMLSDPDTLCHWPNTEPASDPPPHPPPLSSPSIHTQLLFWVENRKGNERR